MDSIHEKELELQEMKAEIDYLKTRNKDLLRENIDLKEQVRMLQNQVNTAGNTVVRHGSGGRPKRDAHWQERYQNVSRMMREGRSAKEICQELKIGRTTYYRYRDTYLQEIGVK